MNERFYLEMSSGKLILLKRLKLKVVDKWKLLGEKDAYVFGKAIEDGWRGRYPFF